MLRLKFLLILISHYCLSVAVINYFNYTSQRNYFVSQGSVEHLKLRYGERCFCREGCNMMRLWETSQSHFIFGFLCVGALLTVSMMSADRKKNATLRCRSNDTTTPD